MYVENYINSLRTEIVELVSRSLSPVAMRYGYSDVSLETNIRWRPLVMIIGSYSSGKSTMINEFIGAKIQETGQAPTDDSFTVITYGESEDVDNSKIQVIEERDGSALLNDPEFPFGTLKKHGQRFAAHFRLKKINSPFLKDIAIIDTPGMLDSISEQDRGYNYQEVIGEFAQMADLIMVLFDPHKAGTVREVHKVLRETLPVRTSEDRLLFVLNRMDECSSLIDMLRVYGTLCWNLSQITGRKDIPMIYLTYSGTAKAAHQPKESLSFLSQLDNQREILKKAILEAPRHRLDHLASFLETHGEQLSHFLEALFSYRQKFAEFRLRYALLGILVSLMISAPGVFRLAAVLPFLTVPQILWGAMGFSIVMLYLIWLTTAQKKLESDFFQKRIAKLDELTSLETQTRRDTWKNIREMVKKYLEKTKGDFSLFKVREDFHAVRKVYNKGASEVRQALSELASLREEDFIAMNEAGIHLPEKKLSQPAEENEGVWEI